MILFFEEDINICFFNNKNISYKKSYTSCYTFEIALIGDYSFTKSNQFYFSNF